MKIKDINYRIKRLTKKYKWKIYPICFICFYVGFAINSGIFYFMKILQDKNIYLISFLGAIYGFMFLIKYVYEITFK